MTPDHEKHGSRADFTCECRTAEGTTVITLAGEIGVRAADHVQDCLVGGGLGPERVRLDLGGVTFMGVAGLVVLLHAADLCRDQGMDLTLVASPAVERVVGLVDAPAGLVDHVIRADPR